MEREEDRETLKQGEIDVGVECMCAHRYTCICE